MPTIKDVARIAGVTPTTVSRVINNRGYLSQNTKQKVYQAMDQLNYSPNAIARSLFSKKSGILGIILPDLRHPFFAELAGYIEFYANQSNYKLLICNSNHNATKEKQFVDLLKSNQIDGLVMASHTLDVDEFARLEYPIVTFDRIIDQFPYVCSDNHQGGVLAAEKLISLGCKKVGHICGNLQLDLLSNQRSWSFIKTMKEHGIEPIIIQTGNDVFDYSHYEELITPLFRDHPDVNGIFTTSDILAAYVSRVCNNLGIHIPKDLKLIGYDDVPLSTWMIPQLSTIRQPMREMAERIVQLLTNVQTRQHYNANIFDVEFIKRATS